MIAMHATTRDNLDLIEESGYLHPRAITKNNYGYGALYRPTEEEDRYVFFGIIPIFGVAGSKMIKFDLDKLIVEKGAKVRFEDPAQIEVLNDVSNNDFDLDGAQGMDAYKMLAAIKEHQPEMISSVEVIVEDSISLNAAFEITDLRYGATHKLKEISKILFENTDFNALAEQYVSEFEDKNDKGQWQVFLQIHGKTVYQTVIDANSVVMAKNKAREIAKNDPEFKDHMLEQPKWIESKNEFFRYYGAAHIRLVRP